MYTTRMGDGANYEPALKPSRGTVMALVLVMIWTVMAFFIGGLPLAVRALVLFMFPLIFVWIPDVVGRAATIRGSSRLEGCPLPWGVHPKVIRSAGWLFILGIPAVWYVFYLSLK